MNPYLIANLQGEDPRLIRVLQDIVDRNNVLSRELESIRSVIPSGTARKENPVEGTLVIPSQDPGGQSGLIRVSKDGVIVSYVNPAEGEFPYIDISTVGNVTTGLDPLHSYTVKAGVLAVDGDHLDVWHSGDYAANANTKRVNIAFGGTTYEDTGARDLRVASGWVSRARIIRTSPTSVLVSEVFSANSVAIDSANVVTTFGEGLFHTTRNTAITGLSNLGTTSMILLVSAEGTATDDITQNLTILKYNRPRSIKLV